MRLSDWPVLRQVTGRDGADRFGRGAAVASPTTRRLRARTETADRVVKSVCPYCAVGCGQNVYVRDGRVIQIEGDPDSPVSRGRLCPKGSSTLQLTTGPARHRRVLYRAPHATDWQTLDLDTAMEMVAERLVASRREGWQEQTDDGHRTRRTMGVASLGGATLDNEENYLIKKLFTALGIVQVENQARICHSSTVVGLGTSFGRGGSTTFPADLQNSDCIVIQGSNMAESHPVAYQWVVEAKARGAAVIHIDPRFSRTSALADLFVPLRAGTDIAFLGGVINHVLTEGKWFEEYVRAYTNASAIVEGEFADTEDLDGIFSGFDEARGGYEPASWAYEGVRINAASGRRDANGTGAAGATPRRDETLQDPRCVFKILERHYSRYTPEVVADVCGVPVETFLRVCDLITSNSGRDRTTSFVYAVGWTQHTVGVQYIRTASILQLLLGNIGRPGGGIEAMRGHASIQGSSDIPTLFDLLPGYIPMPNAYAHPDLGSFLRANSADKGYWERMEDYVVSLLKAWWGPAARVDNDFCYDYLPRITGGHSTYDTVREQLEGRCRGYFLMGQNPAVGSANARVQRKAMANLDWLVVRDFSLIESATWWKDGPEIETGEMSTADIATEVFFFPAAAHTEKAGSFTNTQRMLQWHHQAVEPAGDCRSDLWFVHRLGQLVRRNLAGSQDPVDRPVLDLTWDYPTEGPHDEPDAESVLAEMNGYDADGRPLSGYTELRSDGSTACGCWIYSGVGADGVNQAARRRPHTEQDWMALEWGWAWPSNRRILYNRASADPDGRPWSERKALVWWDDRRETWVGHDVPDFPADKSPDYQPAVGARGIDGLSGSEPFIMQADGRGWLYAPAGLADGPLPTHYEPQETPYDSPLYSRQQNPTRRVIDVEGNEMGPPGSDVFPYVLTTYRLTEHFTAGGMSRWSPYLAELQPELAVEVSPELAAEKGLENAGWATVVSARGAIEARVLVTDRMTPLTVRGRRMHQIGLPYHFGPNGLATGDAVNTLTSMSLDPNTHIQEVKALTVDLIPGRRPRGPALLELVEEYRLRASAAVAGGEGD
jgi:formate dehydrogenase major subunit